MVSLGMTSPEVAIRKFTCLGNSLCNCSFLNGSISVRAASIDGVTPSADLQLLEVIAIDHASTASAEGPRRLREASEVQPTTSSAGRLYGPPDASCTGGLLAS
jgi:hypothetical protein